MKKVILALSISLVICLNLFAQTSGILSKGFINEKVNIAGIGSGDISKEALLNSNGLSLYNKASSTYHITFFKMTLFVSGNKPIELENKNNGQLTAEMRAAIKDAPVGSKLFFEFIKCVDKNNFSHYFSATSFALK
jgi:hypothetical protein